MTIYNIISIKLPKQCHREEQLGVFPLGSGGFQDTLNERLPALTIDKYIHSI